MSLLVPGIMLVVFCQWNEIIPLASFHEAGGFLYATEKKGIAFPLAICYTGIDTGAWKPHVVCFAWCQEEI